MPQTNPGWPGEIFPAGWDFLGFVHILQIQEFPSEKWYATSQIFMHWLGLCLDRLPTFLAQWFWLFVVSTLYWVYV